MYSKEITIKKILHIYSYGGTYYIRNEKYLSKNKKKHILSATFDIVVLQTVIDIPFEVDGGKSKATIRRAYIPALNNFILFTSGDFFKYIYDKKYFDRVIDSWTKEFTIEDEVAINYIRYNRLGDIINDHNIEFPTK